ncbi:MAG: hypothetical protein JSS60_03150 [Verrucomicrobia bacterium]|nr:hypothetical protein [Verrucomicrobiota bacterium]
MRKGTPNALILLSIASFCGVGPLEAESRSNLNDHWSLLGDFVLMRRSDIHNHKLVEDDNKFQCPGRCPNFTVINNEDLVHDFDFEPGFRVGLTFMSDPKNSFEGNFLYLQPWHGEKKRHGNQSLSFPLSNSDYSQDFTNADEAHAEYDSHFWDLEMNYWRHFNPRRIDYFSLSGIAGLRYFHWDEEFKLTMVNPPDKSSYNIHTKNRMLGMQLGLDFQINPTRWLSWEIFAKAGLFANHTEQKQFMGDLDNTVTLRDSERQKRALGVYTDVAAQIGFQCFEHVNLHGGYQAMFFSGLALAPEQISHRVKKDAGKKDHTNGNAIIHGLFIGLVWSF